MIWYDVIPYPDNNERPAALLECAYCYDISVSEMPLNEKHSKTEFLKEGLA